MKPTSSVPACPDPLPAALASEAIRLAAAWIASPARPAASNEVCTGWARVIDRWIANTSLPLYVRKSRANRGHELRHETGRVLVPVDNSTAHWSFAWALQGDIPTIDEVAGLIQADAIPIAMAQTKAEKQEARYTCNRNEVNLNTLGWKVCHIEPVGLRTRGDVTELPIDTLQDHFRRYLSPSNMFLVPKVWSGLGEMPEVVAAAAQACPTRRS